MYYRIIIIQKKEKSAFNIVRDGVSSKFGVVSKVQKKGNEFICLERMK